MQQGLLLPRGRLPVVPDRDPAEAEAGDARGRPCASLLPAVELPEPELAEFLDADDVRVRLVGIGGTGVVTVSQVLGMAALLDGRHASGLDQTGLSQKAGPVVSDMRLTAFPVEDGVSVPSASADVLLGFDLLGAAGAANLRVADPAQTVAIVSERVVPTGQMVIDVDAPPADTAAARAAIDAVTRGRENVYLDAQLIAERLLGDATPANVVVLGAAWQRGAAARLARRACRRRSASTAPASSATSRRSRGAARGSPRRRSCSTRWRIGAEVAASAAALAAAPSLLVASVDRSGRASCAGCSSCACRT